MPTQSTKFQPLPWRCLAKYASVILLLMSMTVAAAGDAIGAASLRGVWLMGTDVAVQIFDCGSLLCGRVVWLKAPLNAQGIMKRDINNPDPGLRGRQICGPSIIWNLQTTGPDHWGEGWFYNPDDGRTYRVSMELKSDDVIMMRIYLGLPIFGETKTLIRVPQGTSEGWC